MPVIAGGRPGGDLRPILVGQDGKVLTGQDDASLLAAAPGPAGTAREQAGVAVGTITSGGRLG